MKDNTILIIMTFIVGIALGAIVCSRPLSSPIDQCEKYFAEYAC